MIAELCFGGLIVYLLSTCIVTNDNEICSKKELKELLGDGVQCSKNIRLSSKYSNEHILMVAPSGTGKSRRFFAHNIKQLNNCSIICNNPNGELRKFNKDKKVYIFNPFDKNTIGYNPLENCRNEFDVEKIATIILSSGMVEDDSKQQEWVEMAKPLLTAYMLYNWYTKTYSFYDMIKNIQIKPLTPRRNEDGVNINKEISIAEEIMDSGIETAIIKFKAFMKGFEARGTISSIYSVMNSCLRLFTDSSVRTILTKQNFDINVLRKQDSILFIEIPEQHTDYFKPLTNVLYNQLLDRLFEAEGKQIYFLLDEFGNTKIENVNTVLSTARKKNISIVGGLQSLNQLKDIYGSKANTIQELFKTLLITGGLRDSNNYISEAIGDTIVYDSNNKSKHKDKLMRPDEIRRMSKDEILVLCGNKRVVKDEMMDILE